MRNKFGKIWHGLLLLAFVMIAASQLVYADSGFLDMQYGPVTTVGQPYTVKFTPGYYSSSGTLYAHILIYDPDRELVTHEEIQYKSMYEEVEYTFTPEKVGTYMLEGYCSRKYRHYISHYPEDKYVINNDKSTATKEAVLIVKCSTHSYGEWTVTKEATDKKEGEEKRTCTVCGDAETKSIPVKEEKDDKKTSSADDTDSKTDNKTSAAKKANTMTVKARKVTASLKTLKKKNVTVKAKNAFTVKKAVGKVTYKKTAGSKKITVSKAGKITVKKKTKKGKYTIKVKVTAAGNNSYKSKSKTVKLTITVK